MPAMTLAGRMLVASAAAGFAVACSGGSNAPDPCAGASKCLRLEIEGLLVASIDQLELDLFYGGVHDTTRLGSAGAPISLPSETAIIFNLPGSPSIDVDAIAVARLGGAVLWAEAFSVAIQQGLPVDERLLVYNQSYRPCMEGAVYCGGTTSILAEAYTLYRCSNGVPYFYARCTEGCTPHFGEDAECVGLGQCRDGGTYCGGHAVDGDPNTLYVCRNFDGTSPVSCARGCQVQGDGNDICK
jgi:hypothetical protein